MSEVYFFADESGFTGFADKPEATQRRIGLFGGVLVQGGQLAAVRDEMNAIANKYARFEAEGKLHITEIQKLDQDAAETLRADCFGLVKRMNLACVFSAIAAEGFHQEYVKRQEGDAKAAAARPVNIIDKNPKLRPGRLHSELFAEAFSKAAALCLDTYGEDEPTTIHVRTDQLDSEVLTEFDAAAREFLEKLLGGTTNLAFYDKTAKKNLQPEIKIEFRGAESYGPIDSIKHTIETDTSPLTLLADVICNSLFDYIQKRFADGQTNDPNDAPAVQGHPLFGHIYGLNQPNGQPALSTVVYRHPTA